MNDERVGSGIPELDMILKGGFPRHSITIIMGAPGSGKTILAEQIAFANATPSAPALYLATVSEPLEKIVAHGQRWPFFDASRVMKDVFYEDLGIALRERGVSALGETVVGFMKTRKPRILIIDSFKALSELAVSPQERRRAVFDLATALTGADCTTFLIGEYAPEMMTQLPEFSIADGVLHLERRDAGGQEQRFLRVEKSRGTATIGGLHAFSITGQGLKVYPRLRSPEVFTGYTERLERLSTGIQGLDDLVQEGFWRGSTTLIAGPTGSGKTMLGLQFLLEGARRGEHGVLVGFQENPVQLARTLKSLDKRGPDLLSKGLIRHAYYSPVEMRLDEVANDLHAAAQHGSVQRVVVDALGDLRRRSLDTGRFMDYLYALTQWFALKKITTLVLHELDELFEFHSVTRAEVSNLADNLVLLRYTPDAEMRRTLRVVKTRGSGHDHHAHELKLGPKGMALKPLKS